MNSTNAYALLHAKLRPNYEHVNKWVFDDLNSNRMYMYQTGIGKMTYVFVLSQLLMFLHYSYLFNKSKT
jgi:hypothetical protein